MTDKKSLSKKGEKAIALAEKEIRIARELIQKRAEANRNGELPTYQFDAEKQVFKPVPLDESLPIKVQGSQHWLELLRVLNVQRRESADYLLHSLIDGQKTNKQLADKVNGALALVEQMEPRDPFETMLALQMVVTHQTALELMGSMRKTEYLSKLDSYGRHSERLMRIYSQQMVTFKKYRNGGKQTVEVKHVHVNEGGQAIIGDVHSGGGRVFFYTISHRV